MNSYKNVNIYNDTGFTIIEIVIVATIITVLVTIALPRLHITVERFRAKEGEQVLFNILGAQKRYSIANNDAYADDLSDLDVTFGINPKHFDPIGDDNVNNLNPPLTVAQVDRVGGAGYRLYVREEGTLTCTGGTPTDICTKLGYVVGP